MDIGRIIIGLFLLIGSPYKFWKKTISLPRMAFSVLFGIGFLVEGVTLAPKYKMEQFLTEGQMEFWGYLRQILIVAIVFMLVRYFWEIWKGKRAEA